MPKGGREPKVCESEFEEYLPWLLAAPLQCDCLKIGVRPIIETKAGSWSGCGCYKSLSPLVKIQNYTLVLICAWHVDEKSYDCICESMISTSTWGVSPPVCFLLLLFFLNSSFYLTRCNILSLGETFFMKDLAAEVVLSMVRCFPSPPFMVSSKTESFGPGVSDRGCYSLLRVRL